MRCLYMNSRRGLGVCELLQVGHMPVPYPCLLPTPLCSPSCPLRWHAAFRNNDVVVRACFCATMQHSVLS